MKPRVRHSGDDGELLAAADALFEEFPHASVLDIAQAMNLARRENRGTGEPPRAHAVLLRARELLSRNAQRVSA